LSERRIAKVLAKPGAILGFALGWLLMPIAVPPGATSDDALGYTLLLSAFVLGCGVPGALLIITAALYWFNGWFDRL
jgi:hypothetical protein